ncbi:BPL-N domain-containing protein [Nocardia terpenica]|uniref:BPL-N domain-containing protein n=1 Tax=Nocardia terpenica TaxID=455432 RepID=UPI001932BA71|nr:BPL-N domain-containing protein [Nocardia terpenica]
MIRRRSVLGGSILAGLLPLLARGGAVADGFDPRPLALVYRGPAAYRRSSNAVAALLSGSGLPLRVEFVGPDEPRRLDAGTLAGAVVYAQPGGGTLAHAWGIMADHADDIRGFVDGGGHYLGFCLGGYLAGATPGFDLLPGDTYRYIDSPDAEVDTPDDAVISVRWRGRPMRMFFHDGPGFRVAPDRVSVLATYDDGSPAALVCRYGRGRVGVSGPHPEATEGWFTAANLDDTDAVHIGTGRDLLDTALFGLP